MVPESPRPVSARVTTTQPAGPLAAADRSLDEEDTIDVSRFVRVFQRHWKVVVVGGCVGGAVAFALASFWPLTYHIVTALFQIATNARADREQNSAASCRLQKALV